MIRRSSALLFSASSAFFSPFAKSTLTQPVPFSTSPSSSKPKFLETLEREKAALDRSKPCFKFPSVLSVEEFCDSVSKFCRDVHSAAKDSNKASLSSSSSPIGHLVPVAQSLAAGIRPTFLRNHLAEVGVFDPKYEREPLVPFESARQFVLMHVRDDAMKRFFADEGNHMMDYVEFDKFAQPQLFLPHSGHPLVSAERGVPCRIPCVMLSGHIDHGKTTLLDTLQSSSIVATEPGLITQTIRAFTIKLHPLEEEEEQEAAEQNQQKQSTSEITFLDTPGHRIFSEIRLSGSRLADVVVLLVALDEGVKGQTEEIVRTAIQYDKPLIVCLTKLDIFAGDARILAKRIKQIRKDLAALGVAVTFVDDCAGGDRESEGILRKTVESMRQRWYRFDNPAAATLAAGEIKQGSDSGDGKAAAENAAGTVHRACIGMCVSAKFKVNVDLLIRVLQLVTTHSSFPRASPAATPTQARVLESFRDFASHGGDSGGSLAAVKASSRGALPTSGGGGGGGRSGSSSGSASQGGPVNIVAILRNGTLRPGMPFVADMGWGVIDKIQSTWGDTLLSAAGAKQHQSSSGDVSIRPGAAVVILGSRDTVCPGAGTHLVQMRTPAEAEFVARFRNRLRFFIERHPKLCHLLRPTGMPTHFLHIGNYGQVECDNNFDYRLMYKEAKPPEVSESPLELQWRANQLPPEQQPTTEEEYGEHVKNSKVIGVYVKVDNWNSARVASRELPRLATRHVTINVVGVGFGPLSEKDIAMFSQCKLIVAFRSPRLTNPHVEYAMKTHGMEYGEFDVYTDMLEWVKAHVLQLQQQESEKRSAEEGAAQGVSGELLKAAGFEQTKMRKMRTKQQMTPRSRAK